MVAINIPLIDFKADQIWKAFILNSLSQSTIILIAILIKQQLDSIYIKHAEEENDIKHVLKGELLQTTWWSVLLTFIVTFIASLSCYWIMYLLFGFGGGMLTNG
jgi:hypothetical protein